MNCDKISVSGRIILACLLLFFAATLVSCGSGAGIGCSDEDDDLGAISFGVDWKDAPKLGSSLDSSRGVWRASIDCSASGVATVSASVYDSSGTALASGGPWACNSHGGLITGVKAGVSRKVVLLGNDSDGKVKHRGELSGVTVQAGGTASADTLTAVSFVPALTAPANGATVTNGAYSFSWIGSGGASSYRIQASTDAGFSATVIDTTVSSTSYTPSIALSGQYYWRVRAIDVMGHEGAWSVVYACSVNSSVDTTSPSIISMSPSEMETGVSVHSVVVVTFNEMMDCSSVNTSTFTVSGTPGAVECNGLSASFTPYGPFSYLSSYTVTIKGSVKDVAGNPIGGGVSWTFFTQLKPITLIAM